MRDLENTIVSNGKVLLIKFLSSAGINTSRFEINPAIEYMAYIRNVQNISDVLLNYLPIRAKNFG